mmetsp:Transcript_15637/g.39684  ORF Transcript_15637/g.39684 Transcript_15637/m.39684 type:complete len:80 (-) Transcript_15637:87-326(-)
MIVCVHHFSIALLLSILLSCFLSLLFNIIFSRHFATFIQNIYFFFGFFRNALGLFVSASSASSSSISSSPYFPSSVQIR